MLLKNIHELSSLFSTKYVYIEVLINIFNTCFQHSKLPFDITGLIPLHYFRFPPLPSIPRNPIEILKGRFARSLRKISGNMYGDISPKDRLGICGYFLSAIHT